MEGGTLFRQFEVGEKQLTAVVFGAGAGPEQFFAVGREHEERSMRAFDEPAQEIGAERELHQPPNGGVVVDGLPIDERSLGFWKLAHDVAKKQTVSRRCRAP